MSDALVMVRPVFALALVLVLFWLWNKHGVKVEKWIKARFPATGIRRERSVTIIEQRRLGRRASVAVVDFGGQRLLLGVSDGQITRLHAVTAPEAPEPDEEPEQAPRPERTDRVAFGQALKTASLQSLTQFIPNRSKKL